MDFDLICALIDLDTRNCNVKERGFLVLYKVSSICREMVLSGREVPESLVSVLSKCLDLVHGKEL